MKIHLEIDDKYVSIEIGLLDDPVDDDEVFVVESQSVLGFQLPDVDSEEEDDEDAEDDDEE